MAAIIHFTSGKQLKISEREFRQIAPKLQAGGVRLYRQGKTGNLIPLNSNTMELIEHIKEEETNAVKSVEQTKELPKEVAPNSEKLDAEAQKLEEESVEEKRKRLEAEMFAKSNCKHEKQELYYTQTNRGKKYFPVCTFCGKRDRFISIEKIKNDEYIGTPNDVWTMKDVMNAKVWTE